MKEATEDPSSAKTAHRSRDLPRGLTQGFAILDHASTPGIMRDCLREHYVDRLTPAGLFQGAGRLADDLKRRGFEEGPAVQAIVSLAGTALRVLKRGQIKQIEKAVAWVYHKQEHGLTCTGVLVLEGLCFVRSRRCSFHEEENSLRQRRRNRQPTQLPPNWTDFMAGAHPSDAYYAAWTYPELGKLEQEHNLNPGDPDTPILIGFRALADRVRAAHRSPGYDKNVAVRMMHLLQDVGLVRKVVNGRSGVRTRKANGYIRVVPFPAPPAVPEGQSPHKSPK